MQLGTKLQIQLIHQILFFAKFILANLMTVMIMIMTLMMTVKMQALAVLNVNSPKRKQQHFQQW